MNDQASLCTVASRRLAFAIRVGIALLCLPLTFAWAASATDKFTLSLRDTAIQEVYEMLSRQGRVNILLGQGVTGSVSLNLFDATLDQAVHAVAEASGFVAERRSNGYFVLSREDAGMNAVSGNTEVRSFKIQYTDPATMTELLTKHLSRYGKITMVEERNLLVVEDLPDFLERIENVLGQVDLRPKQILIEAQILEISLDADQTYGVDWKVPFRVKDGSTGSIGQAALSPRSLAGFFFEVVTPDFEVFINALRTKGKVRTLSTPTLLVLEDEEAEVIVGDRTGFRVTTTINQITTESVEFVESGVILQVKAAVDRDGRVLLQVHPEVSTATLNGGIPSLTTTEVSTQMLADDGQGIFIGGLVKKNDSRTRDGLPGLSDIPLLGGLFSNTKERTLSTETVVVITPHIINGPEDLVSQAKRRRIAREEQAFQPRIDYVERTLPEEHLVHDADSPRHFFSPTPGAAVTPSSPSDR